jgi:hypothetical protein
LPFAIPIEIGAVGWKVDFAEAIANGQSRQSSSGIDRHLNRISAIVLSLAGQISDLVFAQ